MTTFYIINAFTQEPFGGNPAAVMLLHGPAWPDHDWLQGVAAQFNLAETAFVMPPSGPGLPFRLRWFTPIAEVDLCGHATLATAHALWEAGRLGPGSPAHFDTRGGKLSCIRRPDGSIAMDFPAIPSHPVDAPAGLFEALGCGPRDVLRAGPDYFLDLESEAQVARLKPDMEALKAIECRCIGVTALGGSSDIVSRVFGPRVGIPEDPVTGSTHCAIGPWWGARLGKDKLEVKQLSQRGGSMTLRLLGPRIELRGMSITTSLGRWVA